MKIAFVTAWKDPGKSTSGAARVSYEIATAFMKYTDHEILLISPSEESRFFRDEDGMYHLNIQSIGDDSFMYPNFDKKNLKFFNKSLSEFNPDLIHSHTEVFIGNTCQLWAQRHKVPFVHTIHFTPTQMSKFQISSPTTKVLLKFVDTLKIADNNVSFYLNNCDIVISLNEYIKKDLIEFGYKNKIEIIHNGRDLETLNKIPLNIPEFNKKVNLFFVGELSKRKNQVYLIEVMKYLPQNFYLTLIGVEADEKYVSKIKELIQKNELSERVVLKGKINYQEMPKALSEQHLCVSAAKLEVQSLAILESLGAGKPVISLGNHTTNELITTSNKVGVNFDKEVRPEEFAKAIVALAQNKQMYREFSENCKNLSKQFSWETVIKKTEQIYLQLMEKYNKPQITKIKPIYLSLAPEVNTKQFNLLKTVTFMQISIWMTSIIYGAWNSWRSLFKK